MKISSIKFESNPILGDLYLDFTSNGKIVDTIILAGENGCGKSTILSAIYDFSTFNVQSSQYDERRIFKVAFSDYEISVLNNNVNINNIISQIEPASFIFEFKFPWKDWNNIKTICILKDDSQIDISSSFFHESNTKSVFSSIFSDVEINFSPSTISTVTSIELDVDQLISKKTSNNLATEIVQMLVDIQSSDANDYMRYAEKNIGNKIEEKHLDIRMSRFKKAFSYMIENKNYKNIQNLNGAKTVIFEYNGIEIPIDKLSSGEKQIIFRGGFLLKDQKSNKGIVVLIDEPEISLHPTWQLKIINYYKKLFSDEKENQTSQIFIVTHSPFIIHNNSRYDDKVIILKRDSKGKIYTSDNQEFYKWSPEELIEEAFNIDFYKKNQSPLIITEGKTDWKHIKNAFVKFRNLNEYLGLEFEFMEYEDDKIVSGDSGLQKICEHISKVPKEKPVICIFDRDIQNTVTTMHDADKGYKEWGNKTYSFCIPIPEFRKNHKYIVIESYYTNCEIMTLDKDGRRLFLTSEFHEKSGKHKTDYTVNYPTTGYLKDNTDELKSKIIDSKVYNLKEKNIALSKSDFADNILKNVDEFSSFNIAEFKTIINTIKSIIDNGR